MRGWIPWLFPVGMVLVLVLAALTPPWVPGIVLVVVIVGVVPRIWRVYSREHPDRQLPPWLPGGRPPR